jgi:hypothetical protein
VDWKPLLESELRYRGSLCTAAAVEARATAARERFRAWLDELKTTEAASAPEEPRPATFGAVLAAVFGPEDVAVAWQRWSGAGRGNPGQLERLEEGVAASQREVLRTAIWMDALDRTSAAVRAELESLRVAVADLSHDAGLAAGRASELRAAQLAIDIARVKALPEQAAGLDADAAMLRALAEGFDADARRFEAGAARLAAVMGFGVDALAWADRLRGSLERLHAEGSAVLHELDRHLSRLAAEARAADLGAALSPGMDALKRSVGRVHVEARAGVDGLLHRLDALAEAPDLLAPADRDRLAAEAEVAALTTRSRLG